jgi:hypothetical protein
VRQLGPLDRIQAEHLVIAADGTPVVTGLRGEKVAIARVQPDGNWQVTKTSIEAFAVGGTEVDAAGGVWTLSVGSAPEGQSGWVLARDGTPVELRGPDGQVVSPFGLASDPHLGVVVVASVSVYEPAWLFAQRPPPGAPITIEARR